MFMNKRWEWALDVTGVSFDFGGERKKKQIDLCIVNLASKGFGVYY